MKLLLVILLLAVGAVTALALSFRPRPLPATGDYALQPPPASPPAQMRLSVLSTGRMDSVAAMAYRGGTFGDDRVFGMDAVLIEHPAGDVLLDAGFGRDVAAHVQTTLWLMRHSNSKFGIWLPLLKRWR